MYANAVLVELDVGRQFIAAHNANFTCSPIASPNAVAFFDGHKAPLVSRYWLDVSLLTNLKLPPLVVRAGHRYAGRPAPVCNASAGKAQARSRLKRAVSVG